MRARVTTALAAVLALAGTALGGPLNLGDVSAEAKWVVHLDVAAFFASGVGRAVLDQAAADGHTAKIDQFAATMGFDPRTDLAGVTLWGASYEPDGGVAIFRGTFDREKLLGLAKQNEGYGSSPYGDITIHSWVQKPEGRGDDGVRYGAFADAGTVVIARTRTMVEGALDVLAGKANALPAEASVRPPEREGTVLSLGATDIAAAARGPGAAWARMVSMGSLNLGQTGENVFFDLRMYAVDAETAERLRQTVQGAAAFAQLAIANAVQEGKPWAVWAPLVHALRVDGEGLGVTVGIEMEQARLRAMVDEAKAAEAARRAAAPAP